MKAVSYFIINKFTERKEPQYVCHLVHTGMVWLFHIPDPGNGTGTYQLSREMHQKE
jgi:hypothetical protein